nr:3633_t:CDS:2 [Entrophospora candida]
MRQVILETGVILQASGGSSAGCRLGKGTDVLVGMKIEIRPIEVYGDYEQVVEIESDGASQQFAGSESEDINNKLTQTIE